jgi:heat shock protein HspQ
MASVGRQAKYRIGQVVRHRIHPFRGVIFDVDPEFSNTDEWWESIPEDHRPHKDQPFYHLLAENETSYYHAYVSEQNLLPDETGEPVDHPQVHELFGDLDGGQYEVDALSRH